MTEIEQKLRELNFSPASTSALKERTLLEALPFAPPPDYREFLMRFGGGDFDVLMDVRCDEPPPLAEDGLCSFGWFFGVGAGGASLLSALRMTEEEFGPNMFAFASVGGGDMYCLRRTESGVDAVFWDHDTAEVYTVAGSFTEFVKRLQPAEEPVT
ncbi:MAG: SMI1/KNR4 family protein [Myxococcota bacterium]